MKPAGLVLLLAGWAIVLTAAALLKPTPARAGFVLAGVGVEAMGLVLLVRAHIVPRGDRS